MSGKEVFKSSLTLLETLPDSSTAFFLTGSLTLLETLPDSSTAFFLTGSLTGCICLLSIELLLFSSVSFFNFSITEFFLFFS